MFGFGEKAVLIPLRNLPPSCTAAEVQTFSHTLPEHRRSFLPRALQPLAMDLQNTRKCRGLFHAFLESTDPKTWLYDPDTVRGLQSLYGAGQGTDVLSIVRFSLVGSTGVENFVHPDLRPGVVLNDTVFERAGLLEYQLRPFEEVRRQGWLHQGDPSAGKNAIAVFDRTSDQGTDFGDYHDFETSSRHRDQMTPDQIKATNDWLAGLLARAFAYTANVRLNLETPVERNG